MEFVLQQFDLLGTWVPSAAPWAADYCKLSAQFHAARLQIHTLFPSAKTEEGIKGGVVLLRVQPPPGCTPATAPPLRLAARYCDRWV